MNSGDMLVVGAKKSGDSSLIKELESITKANLVSKAKKKSKKVKKLKPWK